MMRTSYFLVIVLTSWLLLGGCESSSGRSDARPAPANSPDTNQDRPNRGSGLWDMLDASRADKENRLRFERAREVRQQQEVERGMAQVPVEQRQKMMQWWGEFLNNDPQWVQHRFDWRAYGPEAREILVENLLIAMIKAYEQNNGQVFRRARSEIYEMPTEAVPYLVAGISDRMGDAFVRKHCIEMLGLIGRPALPEIRSAYRSKSVPVKIEFLNVVKEMGPLGTPDSIPFLKEALDDADDYRVQLAAIQALGTSQDAGSIPVLISCLRDDDVSVRKFAAGSLGFFQGDAVVEALIGALEAAERRALPENRESDVMANCQHSLTVVTGQRFRRSSEWRNWWKRR